MRDLTDWTVPQLVRRYASLRARSATIHERIATGTVSPLTGRPYSPIGREATHLHDEIINVITELRKRGVLD